MADIVNLTIDDQKLSVPKGTLVIEAAKEFPQLGRFAIRDMGQTVAAGMVIEVKKKAV